MEVASCATAGAPVRGIRPGRTEGGWDTAAILGDPDVNQFVPASK